MNTSQLAKCDITVPFGSHITVDIVFNDELIRIEANYDTIGYGDPIPQALINSMIFKLPNISGSPMKFLLGSSEILTSGFLSAIEAFVNETTEVSVKVKL